jgi:hypothetical protein
MRVRRGAVVGGGLLTLATLTSCASPGLLSVPVSPSPTPCPSSAAPVPVEDLDVPTPIACTVGGRDLLFPDGAEMEAGAGGNSSATIEGHPGYSYANVDMGAWGFVAWRVSKAGATEWWGTDRGVRAVQAAWGADQPYQG